MNPSASEPCANSIMTLKFYAMPCLLPRMFDLRSIPILTFSLFFKKCVVYKSSNIHAYKKGDITEITMPYHHQFRNLCTVCKAKSAATCFFLAQVTFFYLVNNFQKVLQMCLPQRRHEKLIPSSLSQTDCTPFLCFIYVAAVSDFRKGMSKSSVYNRVGGVGEQQVGGKVVLSGHLTSDGRLITTPFESMVSFSR